MMMVMDSKLGTSAQNSIKTLKERTPPRYCDSHTTWTPIVLAERIAYKLTETTCYVSDIGTQCEHQLVHSGCTEQSQESAEHGLYRAKWSATPSHDHT